MSTAEALARILYPNTAQGSMYAAGGQALLATPTPQLSQPWQTALAAGAQNLLGYGLQGYAQYRANQDNLANAAALAPQLAGMGVNLSPELQAGLTNENPQVRQVALALAGSSMDAQAAQQAKMAELKATQQGKAFEAMMSGDPARQRTAAQFMQAQGDTSDLTMQLANAQPAGPKPKPLNEVTPVMTKLNDMRSFQDTAQELKTLAEQMDDNYASRQIKAKAVPSSPEYKFYALLDSAQQRYAGAEQSGVLTDQDRAIYGSLFKGNPLLESKKVIQDRMQTIMDRGAQNFATTLDTLERANIDVSAFKPLIAKPQQQRTAAELIAAQQPTAPLQQTGMVPPTAGPAPTGAAAAQPQQPPLRAMSEDGKQVIEFDYNTWQWVPAK